MPGHNGHPHSRRTRLVVVKVHEYELWLIRRWEWYLQPCQLLSYVARGVWRAFKEVGGV